MRVTLAMLLLLFFAGLSTASEVSARPLFGLVPSKERGVTEALTRGIQLALEEEVARDGLRLELVVGARPGPWGSAAAVAVDLASDEAVLAIVTPPDRETAHLLLQVGTRSHLPIVTTAGMPSLTSTGSTWLLSVARDQQSGDRFETPAGVEFARRFMRTYHCAADRNAAAGFDAASAILAGVRGGDTRRDTLVPAVMADAAIVGATGAFCFDADGRRRSLSTEWTHGPCVHRMGEVDTVNEGPLDPIEGDPQRTAAESLVPEWVTQLGVPAWVSGPDRRIAYMSDRARTVLGIGEESAIGQRCFDVIASMDSDSKPFCCPECAVLQQARRQEEIEPRRVQVSLENGELQWLQLIVVPVRGADGSWPWLVHCAVDANRDQRITQYLERIANRNGAGEGNDLPDPEQLLTKREVEVLGLLARDLDMAEIAKQLFISRTTVRNHVQHILSKLGVHSIQEAVALHLL